jgi:hypothetical protein
MNIPANKLKRPMGVFGWLQADTVAAVWIAAAAIHREKNTVEVAAAAGLQPQQAAANKQKQQSHHHYRLGEVGIPTVHRSNLNGGKMAPHRRDNDITSTTH